MPLAKSHTVVWMTWGNYSTGHERMNLQNIDWVVTALCVLSLRHIQRQYMKTSVSVIELGDAITTNKQKTQTCSKLERLNVPI